MAERECGGCDRLVLRRDDNLEFGKQLEGTLVRAWHHREKNLIVVKGRTASDGMIAFDLPCAGSWMVSLVHMIPLKDVPDYDWQSYWGNLTFALSP